MSASQRPHLIIPSEIQVREFDAKLFLACLAAERGYKSIVGFRVAIHNAIAAMPRGIYLAKDAAATSCKMFGILDGLGMPIVAWDEEAILYYSIDQFMARRTCACTLSRVSRYLTWGKVQRDALASRQAFAGIPLDATGNPRTDMLRPQLRPFYDREVAQLAARFGRMILINSNFGRLNHFLAHRRLTPSAPGELASRNLRTSDPPLEVWRFRENILHQFRALIPELARSFAGHTILVRPHPAEAHQFWTDAAQGMPNVRVVHEGSVVPWLLAADVMIHNGCTTGIEGYLLGRPMIAFRPLQDPQNELMLPNDLASPATTVEQVVASARALVAAGRPSPPSAAALAELTATVSGIDGAFASERVLDVIDRLVDAGEHRRPARMRDRVGAYRRSLVRTASKTLQSTLPFHKNSRQNNEHRFSGLSVREVEDKVDRLRACAGRFAGIRVRQVRANVFEVAPA